MIHPDALIVDLEPEGFAKLSEVTSHRLYAVRTEVQILHRGGEVLNVVDTKRGVINDFRESFIDPAARAREVLSASGADRVIVIDRDAVDDLSVEQVELGQRVATQTELLWRGSQAFFDHPAVAVAPAPEPSPWPAISEFARTMGDDYWAVFGAWQEEVLFLSLIARVEQGLVTFLTSADHFGVRPIRSDAGKLLEAVEARGPVEVALFCDFEGFEAALRSDNPMNELAQLAGGDVLFERNARRLLERGKP